MDNDLTYGKLQEKFCEKFPGLKRYMNDYRPAAGINTIRIWFDNGMDIVVSYDQDKDEFMLTSRQ
ncbi:hypothetical protein RE628_11410 [Paenibacillus sp. D2_2]|uniref:hypothetical protein n=1 Tax=Paenibacillus sp. D2_2 TaxID=3073092 RepID=UPI00281506BD|nr:hypothetical protein [Paenibacillus sp. D2_2]WMT42835.1 hypothetical protein RE628_11410 [Paenibacillus sp. D2_2]